MRILLVDDHIMVREGLRCFLDSQRDMIVVGEAGDGVEACQQVQALHPDMVLMDDTLPELDGADAIGRIVDSVPTTKVLAVATYRDDARISQFFAAGAAGYLLKKSSCQELMNAMQIVSTGQLYLDPTIAGWAVNSVLAQIMGAVATQQLSACETEVLVAMAWGHPHREIATRLHISLVTVEAYRTRIRQKTGLTTRAEMTSYALRRGWMTDESEMRRRQSHTEEPGPKRRVPVTTSTVKT